MLVEVTVAGLAVDPKSNLPLVLLTDVEKQRTLPIWIGIFEASAIAARLEGIRLARPMTHDLVRNVVTGLNGTLLRVEIHALKENTFYSALVMRTAVGDEIRIDARPSDAIAVALRSGAPILVDEELLNQAPAIAQSGNLKADPKSAEEWGEILNNLSDEAFGKYKM
jgi:bifunctional DNase/RNase